MTFFKNVFFAGKNIQLKNSNFPLLLLGIAGVIFYVIVVKEYPDISLHTKLMLQPWGPEIYSHLLYFVILKLLTLGSYNLSIVNAIAIILLLFFELFKYVLIRQYLETELNTSGKITPLLTGLFAFCLCIVHAIPYRFPQMYTGQFTATVWHNSTTIMLIPLAILQFRKALHVLENNDKKVGYSLIWITILSILVKPNFFLCYALAFPLLFFSKKGLIIGRSTFRDMLHIFIGIFILIIEYLVTYHDHNSAEIMIAPFKVWSYYSNHLLIAFLLSVLFPLLYLILHWKKAISSTGIIFSWLLFVIALVIFICFAESGERFVHANFIWQITPSLLLLFMTSFSGWLKDAGTNYKKYAPRDLCLAIAFLLHVGAGFLYIIKIPKFGIW